MGVLPSGANAPPVPPVLVALARSGWASVKEPLVSRPGAVALGSATVRLASPALETTLAAIVVA